MAIDADGAPDRCLSTRLAGTARPGFRWTASCPGWRARFRRPPIRPPGRHSQTRLRGHFPRLFRLLLHLYGNRYDFFYHLERILETAAEMWLARPADLKALDAAREADRGWFQSQKMLGGVCYVDLFAGNLAGIRARIPYFKELGLTYLHLMPLFAGARGRKRRRLRGQRLSGGEPRAGHDGRTGGAGPRAAQRTASAWWWTSSSTTPPTSTSGRRRALAGDPEYQDFYHMFPDRQMPDAYERTLREIFPDVRRGSFTYRPGRRGTLGVDHLQQLPVGSELRQPGRLPRHAGGDAVPGQRGRRGAAAGCGGVHLEADGHHLREPARGAHADPGVQRPGAHRGARRCSSSRRPSSTPTRWPSTSARASASSRTTRC